MVKRVNLSTALHTGESKTKPQGFENTAAGLGVGLGATAGAPPKPLRAMKPQSLAADQFFYFFLRLRKNEVKRVVQRAQSLYPSDSRERLSRRLINTQTTLSFMAGALLNIPLLLPGAGQALKFVGVAGGTSMMTRMHLYLILEIAHIYGHDVDDRARVPEMMAIIASSGLAAGAPWLVQRMGWPQLAAIPAAGLTVAAITQMIGHSAIAYYQRRAGGALPVPASA